LLHLERIADRDAIGIQRSFFTVGGTKNLPIPERKLMKVIRPHPLKLAVASLFCVAPLLLSAPVHAEGSDGYLTTSAGNPVRSSSGECVHTSSWQEGFRFADCQPAPVVEAPAPKVTEAPAPLVEAPAPVVEAPPAPVPQNVPFRVSMDALFDFDKSALRPEGKAALDELAQRLAVTQYDKLTIVGHADRIGPAAYNEKLSKRRASAIRDYLIAQGIDAQRMTASGVGESQPITSCHGLHGKRLIACLQPDRHAELTAVGNELRVSDASQ
jgi:OOP family OmpA-OmpF porin